MQKEIPNQFGLSVKKKKEVITIDQLYLLQKEMKEFVKHFKKHENMKKRDNIFKIYKTKIIIGFIDKMINRGIVENIEYHTERNKEYITFEQIKKEKL